MCLSRGRCGGDTCRRRRGAVVWTTRPYSFGSNVSLESHFRICRPTKVPAGHTESRSPRLQLRCANLWA